MRNKDNKNGSLSEIQEEIDKKVESFMGSPPEDKVPDPKKEPGDIVEPEKGITKDEPKGAPEITDETPVGPAPDVKEEPKDPDIDRAVDDIAATESDELLAAEDAEVAKAFEPKKTGLKQRATDFFKHWWGNKRARWITIILLIALMAAAIVIPTTRYFVLNTVGVRSSSSVTVLDSSTQLPLKNVEVTAAGKTTMTDSEGNARLTGIKLGKTQLKIHKSAFADIGQKVTIGWGSNPLGSFALKAVGTQFAFIVTDWLSGKPIEKAEASSGLADAISDKDGKILLTTDITDEEDLQVTIKAENYRDEVLMVPITAKDVRAVSMVPGRKEVFVSRRSGTYDLYKIDVDGKNEEILLKGTGSERDDIAIVPHPTEELVAYVSTRDNARNSDGYLMSTLSLINVDENNAVSLGQSERIQIIGWVGQRLIYVQVAAGASAANPRRERLISYDLETTIKRELATSNSFNDVMVAGDSVYYAPSSAYQSSNAAGFYKAAGDGSNLQTILDTEVWNAFRAGYNNLNLSAAQDWYEYKLGDKTASRLPGQPAMLVNHVFVDSPDKKNSLWVDSRDGKGVLLAYDIAANSDKLLKTQSGLAYPVRWISDNTAIYRIKTDQETADYVLNTEGGEARKIVDVTNTAGLAQWYY